MKKELSVCSVKKFMRKPELKLCGNRSLEDWESVRVSGVPYVGFIFANSVRRVTDEQVKVWLNEYPPLNDTKIVGVFVNPELEELAQTVSEVPLDVLQLHGSETPAFVAKVKQMTGKTIWKVIHHSKCSLEEMKRFEGVVDGYVVDTKLPGQWGGTGKRFDWDSIPSYQAEAASQKVPLFVAGGVKLDNVQELLSYQLDGIDVSSGIETNDRKDKAKMNDLIERLG
jgi:phosphoribosylanthranilate isomerase